VASGAAAELSGKTILNGRPPPEVLVDLTDFPECRRVHPDPLYTCHYIVSSEGGLANVLVYIKDGLSGHTFPAPTNMPVLDQKNCRIRPYVMGVVTNQKFQIKNSEPYMDTIHALPKINKEFNIAQPLTGMISVQRFDKPEVLVRIKCEVHPWEFAFIGVVEHRFFAVSDTNGNFRLPPDLPAGKYVVAAVHPKAGTNTQEIVLGEQDKKAIQFVFEPGPAAPPGR
jgi:hypothetical protein